MAIVKYQCDTCLREIELLENAKGLTTFSNCIITENCRGSLYKIDRNQYNIRESFREADPDQNLVNYSPRKVFFEFEKSIPSKKWVVNHNLGSYPAISVFVETAGGENIIELNKDEYTRVDTTKNSLEINFVDNQVGVVHAIARSVSELDIEELEMPENDFLISYNGTISLAVLSKIYEDDLNPGDTVGAIKNLTVKLDVTLKEPNQEEIFCTETLSGSSASPWFDYPGIIFRKRRNYIVKTANILDLRVFQERYGSLSEIPELTEFKINRIKIEEESPIPDAPPVRSTQWNSIRSKNLLFLLANEPFTKFDKILDRVIDVGESNIENANGKKFVFLGGEMYAASGDVEKVYPPIEKDDIPEDIPDLTLSPQPTLTPTPTPTISLTPSISPTPTPSVTSSVTPTPTISLTPSISPTPTPSVTSSVTPTPTPTPSASVPLALDTQIYVFTENEQIHRYTLDAGGVLTFNDTYNVTSSSITTGAGVNPIVRDKSRLYVLGADNIIEVSLNPNGSVNSDTVIASTTSASRFKSNLAGTLGVTQHFSPNGEYRLFDLTNGTLIDTLAPHPDGAGPMLWVSDNRLVIQRGSTGVFLYAVDDITGFTEVDSITFTSNVYINTTPTKENELFVQTISGLDAEIFILDISLGSLNIIQQQLVSNFEKDGRELAGFYDGNVQRIFSSTAIEYDGMSISNLGGINPWSLYNGNGSTAPTKDLNRVVYINFAFGTTRPNFYILDYTAGPGPETTENPAGSTAVCGIVTDYVPYEVIGPTPTPSVTSSNTPTPTPSVTSSNTPTPTPTMTPTPSPTPSISISATATPTPTPSVTSSNTPTPTPTMTPTPSTSSPAPMEFTYDTTSSFTGTSLTLPLIGPGNVTVDWGDGSSNNYSSVTNTDLNASHTYSSGGQYQIKITGSLEEFGGFTSPWNASGVTAVQSFGDLGLVSLAAAFYQSPELTAIPSTLPSTVENISYMFQESLFNLSIDSWDVSNVTNMQGMFYQAPLFNQPLNGWNTASVLDMSFMFDGASSFDQPLDNWNTSSVLDMQRMFRNTSFNQPLNSWITTNVTNMNSMFEFNTAFNQDLNNWNTINVEDMRWMFNGATAFNGNITTWNTGSVNSMRSMFQDASNFNQDLSGWNTISVADISYMFNNAEVFNGDITTWNTSSVLEMEATFQNAVAFTQNISGWNTSSVTNMNWMFNGAILFNGNISGWNTGNVESMRSMFQFAISFNQDLSGWITTNVTDMSYMFNNALAFNGNITTWNTTSVLDMNTMFQNADSFNQDIGNWNTGSVTNMDWMFWGADVFNQDLSAWCVSQIASAPTGFDTNASAWTDPRPNWGAACVTPTPTPTP